MTSKNSVARVQQRMVEVSRSRFKIFVFKRNNQSELEISGFLIGLYVFQLELNQKKMWKSLNIEVLLVKCTRMILHANTGTITVTTARG